MIAKLFDMIARLDAAIMRDKAIVSAAEGRIELARRRKALAQRLIAKQRTDGHGPQERRIKLKEHQ